MSLRARIEAVIYAAEEPVTLAQLTAVFAEDALAERSARLAGESAAYPESTASPQISAATKLSGPEQASTAETAADEHAIQPASDVAIEQAVEHPEQVAATQPDGFVGEPGLSPGSDDAYADPGGEALLEEKRQARIRERQAREEVRRIIDELIADYDHGERGMEIREIAGGYRVATRPEYHDAVRSFVKSLKPPMKLSLQALETLAVIAYKQPITAPEVSEIRGVDSGGVLGSLISRKLVTTAGRKQVIGRPILYKTTKEFLLRFGLKDLAELPSMEEFEKMAGELAEPEQSEPEPAEAGQQESEQVSLATQLNLPREPASSAGSVNAPGLPESPAATDPTPSYEEEPPMRTAQNPQLEDEPGGEQATEQGAVAFPDEPHTAAEVHAAPELAQAHDEEEVAAKARASVQVDDESDDLNDLPGVTRDTAGRVSIDSVRSNKPGLTEEDQ